MRIGLLLAAALALLLAGCEMQSAPGAVSVGPSARAANSEAAATPAVTTTLRTSPTSTTPQAGPWAAWQATVEAPAPATPAAVQRPAVSPTEVARAAGVGPLSTSVQTLPAPPTPPLPKLRIISHGPSTAPAVALTFDDGPHPNFTPRLLEILAQYRVRATFFLVGKMAVARPDLVRAEQQAGHCLGNHTYDHPDLVRVTHQEVHCQWEACNQALERLTGVAPRFCRPPGGEHNDSVVWLANELGLTVVMWNDYAADAGKPTAASIASRTVATAKNGSIILLHDGIQQTTDALPRIIEGLRNRGFAFQTVAEMAHALEAHAGKKP